MVCRREKSVKTKKIKEYMLNQQKVYKGVLFLIDIKNRVFKKRVEHG